MGRLFERFVSRYLDAAKDPGVLEAAPIYLAWRCLVVASPRFYPKMGEEQRDALLSLAERVLAAPRFEVALAAGLFK